MMVFLLGQYEDGKLDEAQVIALFQALLDTGAVYALQGSYQRTAHKLLMAGLITRSPSKKVRRRAAKKASKVT